jgi:hypothetical protein
VVRQVAAVRAFGGKIAVNERPELPAALIAEAKTKPGGWVYEIVGDYGADDAVPPTAIRGAWKVGEDGEVVGDFLPNPVFEPPSSTARG